MKEAQAVLRRNRIAAVAVAFAATLSFGALAAATAGVALAAPVHVHGISGSGGAHTNGIQGSGHNAITDGIQGTGARPGGISGGGQA
jgi:hypothetical protein